MVTFLVAGMFLCKPSQAQNQVEDAIKQLSSQNVTGYLQPLLNGFGANMNSGFAGSAAIDNSFFFRIDAIGMATIIGGNEQVYEAVPPHPFAQQPVETATIFGDQGAVVEGPEGIRYYMQNGQLNLEYMPLIMPQITIGNILNTQLVVRFFTYSTDSDVPDIDLIGIGIRHGLNQYLPGFPVDLAAGVYYQNFKIGDIMDTNTLSVDARASKKLGMLTLYGGAQYEHANMNLQYTYTGPAAEEEQMIDLDFESENRVRAFAGINLTLGLVHLRGDFNIGRVSVVSAAVGIGF